MWADYGQTDRGNSYGRRKSSSLQMLQEEPEEDEWGRRPSISDLDENLQKVIYGFNPAG